MISKYTYKKLEWIDVESPTREEVRALSEEYGLPVLVGDELLAPAMPSKVDRYSECIYLVLHFPRTIHTKHTNEVPQEIDFVIGKNFLMTIHYETSDPLHEFAKTFEVHSTLDKSPIGNHAGFLLFFIIRELYRSSMYELEAMDKKLIEIEHEIFNGNEKKMVKQIAQISRALLDFRQALRFHHGILESLEKAGSEFFGADFSYHLSAVTGEYNKVHTTIESHKETLTDLRKTNDSLLTLKTNDAIKTLTTLSFVLLPVGIIAWIFGMTTAFPLIRNPLEFYRVLGIMALSVIIMFVYSRMRKWL
jgi:magnesium transporter